MNDEPRLFASDEVIRRTGEGMLVCSLAKSEWTHEAHLATCTWLILERDDIMPERDLPGLIRRYNESVGGVNDATQGYHETITQVFIRGVRLALARSAGSLAERVNDLLRSPQGRRDWPLGFYSRERLFSPEARLGWVEPDLAELPVMNGFVTAPSREAVEPIRIIPTKVGNQEHRPGQAGTD